MQILWLPHAQAVHPAEQYRQEVAQNSELKACLALVPQQVLLGNSSFNTGNSISSGLPNYVRNRIKAIAAILDKA